MLKLKQTNKKFYNKWLYKVSLYMPGVTILRLKFNIPLTDFLIAGSIGESHRRSSTHHKAIGNKDNLLKLLYFLSNYNESTWCKRIEMNVIDLYTNDKEFYDAAALEFASLVQTLCEPSEASIHLLDDSNKITAKKLPHKKYKYKVYLLPHKLANDKIGKTEYLKWITTQQDRILISDSVKLWFMTTNWNWDRRYLYVEDSATLLLLKLRNSEVVGRIYEYVIIDK
jgi:hypothetical protein